MKANRLRAQMALVGVSQAELARICGMTENTLSNKLLGKTEFRADEIIAVCDALSITSADDKADIFLSGESH